MVIDMRKTCTKCDIEKHLSEFHKSKNTKDGHRYWCKTCCRKYNKEYQKTPAGIFMQVRGRNNFFKDHDFNLERSEFEKWYNLQEKKCVYCSLPEELIPFFKEKYSGWADRFTIDCKDNSIGYRIDNIVLACEVCNRLKGSVLTHDEMFEIGQKYIRPKWEGETKNG